MNTKAISTRRNTAGISLVALVVTIIVLIILTGAVVATFMEGGIIDKAKDAVKKSDSATLQESYNLAYNTAMIEEVTGTGVKVNKVTVLKETVEDLGLKGFTFNGNEVKYTGDNNEIAKWVNANFIFDSLAKVNYIFSEVNGVTYMTGITGDKNAEDMEEDFWGKVAEIEAAGFTVEGEDAADGYISTGYKIMKDGEEYATIVIKGDVDGSICIDGSDIGTLVAILNAGEGTDIELIAADMNCDGCVSRDDLNLILLAMDIETANKYQTVSISNVPTSIVDEEKYHWYTKEEIKTSLENANYEIVDNNSNYLGELSLQVTISSGTTYAEFEQGMRDTIGVEQLKANVSNKNAEIENNVKFTIEMPIEINSTTYSNINKITIQPIIQ